MGTGRRVFKLSAMRSKADLRRTLRRSGSRHIRTFRMDAPHDADARISVRFCVGQDYGDTVKVRATWIAAIAALFLGTANASGPAYLPPLGEGGPTACPAHAGVYTFRSEIVQFGNGTAHIESAARRVGRECQSMVALHISSRGKPRVVDLPQDGTETLVDFSPDQSKLLLSRELEWRYPNEAHRSVLIASVSVETGDLRWWNVWDVLQWKDCDATVEAQGFLPNGTAVIRVRPSVMRPNRHPDCVSTPRLYAVDTVSGSATVLPDATTIQRNGNVARPRLQTCAADPDLVGVCFWLHGRMSYYNGGPSTRIWRIGTKRMLGVPSETVPETIAPHFNGFDDEVTGDFKVCPLTRRKPGVMQMVCVEAAKHVIYSKR